jgi:hypothetical protein
VGSIRNVVPEVRGRHSCRPTPVYLEKQGLQVGGGKALGEDLDQVGYVGLADDPLKGGPSAIAVLGQGQHFERRRQLRGRVPADPDVERRGVDHPVAGQRVPIAQLSRP